ncbi:aminotransferase class IV [Spirosoma fluminis]
MNLVYNSDILSENEFTIDASDRAFQYGDGLFETIRYERGQLWFWPDHYDRLTQGLSALQLNLPADVDASTLKRLILELLAANGLSDQPARIKIQVWRRPGGLYTPTHHDGNFLISARPGRSFAVTGQTNVVIYNSFRLSPSPISSFKTINALPYVLAGLYKQEQGSDDVILLDTQGHLAECIASNLFWIANNTLYTPSLQSGCIGGIARRQMLNTFPNVQEGLFLPDTLLNADVVFAANVMGIQLFQGEFTKAFGEQIRQLFTETSLL